MDKIIIEVLADGTIRTETDKVSLANHAGAEAFLREIGRLAGGTVKRMKKIGANLAEALHVHTQDGHTH